MNKRKCSIDVWEHGRWPTQHQCPYTAKVERNGKWYCTIHDPERVERKRAERSAQWSAEWEREKKELKLRQAAIKAVTAINLDNPLAVCENLEKLVDACRAALARLTMIHPYGETYLKNQLSQVIAAIEKKP